MIIYSHSKLDVARKCLKQYYYQYVLKLEKKDDKSFTEFGNLIHNILEQYTGGGKQELKHLYETLRPKYKFCIKDFKERIPVALKNIHQFWTNTLKGAVYKPEEEITTILCDDVYVKGKIDLIIFDGSKNVKIVDYKTSKSKKYANYANQLAMYMFLVNSKYGTPYENMTTEIFYPSLLPNEKNGDSVLNESYEHITSKYTLDESDVSILLEEIEAIHHRIQRAEKNNKWVAKQSWFNCKFCPFYDVCDEKQIIDN